MTIIDQALVDKVSSGAKEREKVPAPRRYERITPAKATEMAYRQGNTNR